MALGFTIQKQPTRFPGGITNSKPLSPLNLIETVSPYRELMLGWAYNDVPAMPTGNTPASNNAWTVTKTTTTGTASFADAAVWPQRYLMTTGTTANDQIVMQEVRSFKKNFLNLRKVIVAGSFRVTSTIANSKGSIGVFTGTSNSSLGNDQFTFNWSGATLNFVNRNNGGTALTTAVSTGLLVNTLYGVAAVLDPIASVVQIYFGVIDSMDLENSANVPPTLPLVKSAVSVSTSNIPDGTNAVLFGFGGQTTAGAAATIEFGPCVGYFA